MAQHKHRKRIQTILMLMILNILEHKVQSEEKKCIYLKLGGLVSAICSHMELTSIPSDLNIDIEFLKLVNNPIAEIKRNDMMRFKNLKIFTYQYDNASTTKPVKIESNAFVDLPELREIDLYRVNLSESGFIILPMKMEIVSITESFLHDNVFDFSILENLVVLNLLSNNLTVVPKTHKYAPLEYVSLALNPIEIYPLSLIVRYCKLRHYYIKFKINNKYTKTANDKCECSRWEYWYFRKNIKGYLNPHQFNCPSKEPCYQELIPKEWEQLWDDCINNVRDPSHDLKEDTPPPPVNSDTNVSPDQLEPVNATPAIEKKPILKIFFLLMLLLALIIVLSAICFYLIYRKKTQSQYDQENAVPEPTSQEDDE